MRRYLIGKRQSCRPQIPLEDVLQGIETRIWDTLACGRDPSLDCLLAFSQKQRHGHIFALYRYALLGRMPSAGQGEGACRSSTNWLVADHDPLSPQGSASHTAPVRWQVEDGGMVV